MTKKAAALLLAASLAVSVCATPVFAVEIGSTEGDTTGTGTTTNVLYEVTEAYTWSVPATIDFGKDAGVKNTSTVLANSNDKGKTAEKDGENKEWKGTAPKVMVTKNTIASGKSLKITLKPENPATGFTVVNGDDSLSYTVKTTAEKKDDNKIDPYTPIIVDATTNQILELKAGVNTGEVELEFKLTTTTATAEVAGEYKGQIVFTADAKSAPTT